MLAEALDYYHELLACEHLSSTQEVLTQAIEDYGLIFGGRAICSVLRPYFIDESTYEMVRHASQVLMRAIAGLGRRLAADPILRNELDLSAEEEEIIKIDHGYGAPDVSARLDGFLSPTGEFNFVEYNADSPGGLAYGDVLGQVFSSMPIMQAFSTRYNTRAVPVRTLVFGALLTTYNRWGGKHLPNIAIIDWKGVGTYSEFLILQAYFEAQGCRVKVADPNDLEYRDGQLFIRDYRVDLVYKRVLVGELLAKYGLKHPLIEAVRARAVCLVNGFRVQLLYKKIIFAILSDPNYNYLFEPEVNAVLTRYIPWTRKVRKCKTRYRDVTIDLLSFIADNRERLVLKPNGEYGGKGVVLGWEVSDEHWQSTLQTALTSSYIVQERVPLGCEVFPSFVDGELRFDQRFMDLDPYVWNGEGVEGCGVRLSKLALLNVTAGGGSATPMFIISKRS